jgi:hypothetical protein
MQDDSGKGEISWTASESVEYQRKGGWYAVLIIVTVIIIGGAVALQIFLDIQLWSTALLALVIFIAIMIVSRKKPRNLNYRLNRDGIYIEKKLYPWSNFRAFGINNDGALWTVSLIPSKRFSMDLSMFIPADKGEQIVDALGVILPMEKISTNAIDQMARRLKL